MSSNPSNRKNYSLSKFRQGNKTVGSSAPHYSNKMAGSPAPHFVNEMIKESNNKFKLVWSIILTIICFVALAVGQTASVVGNIDHIA